MGVFSILKKQIQITSYRDVPIRADLRWLFVFILLALISANSFNILVGNFPVSLGIGFLVSFLFFVSVLIHELAHSRMAQHEGIRVIEIVLHPFGGLARLRREPETPESEFKIAVAGPVASFVLGGVFLSASWFFSTLSENVFTPVFFFLAFGNLLIAIFNLFPGFPLDGGRILRAYLRRNGKDANEATVITGIFGQIIAATLIFLGLFYLLARRDAVTGVWAILVGVFLFDSARQIIKECKEMKRLTPEDVMEVPVAVSPDMFIQEFVDKILILYRATTFPVAKERHAYGIIHLEQIKKISKKEWTEIKISEVMIPIAPELFVDLSANLDEITLLLKGNETGALCVVDDNGLLVGFIRSERVRSFIS